MLSKFSPLPKLKKLLHLHDRNFFETCKRNKSKDAVLISGSPIHNDMFLMNLCLLFASLSPIYFMQTGSETELFLTHIVDF